MFHQKVGPSEACRVYNNTPIVCVSSSRQKGQHFACKCGNSLSLHQFETKRRKRERERERVSRLMFDEANKSFSVLIKNEGFSLLILDAE